MEFYSLLLFLFRQNIDFPHYNSQHLGLKRVSRSNMKIKHFAREKTIQGTTCLLGVYRSIDGTCVANQIARLRDSRSLRYANLFFAVKILCVKKTF